MSLLVGDGADPVAGAEAAEMGGISDLEAILIERIGLTTLADALDEATRRLVASGGMLALIPAAGSA